MKNTSTTLISGAVTALFLMGLAAPAYGQAAITSSARSIEAATAIINDVDGDTVDTDLSSSNSIGTWDQSAFSAVIPGNPVLWASADLTSNVTAEQISAAGIVERGITSGILDGFGSTANARIEMTIEFFIAADTPFSLDLLFDDGALGTNGIAFQFTLASMTDTVVNVVDNSGLINPVAMNFNGTLAPGNYTLFTFVETTEDFAGSNTYNGVPASFDFTLTIPGPSGLAMLGVPVCVLGLRRRR